MVFIERKLDVKVEYSSRDMYGIDKDYNLIDLNKVDIRWLF